MLGTLVNMIAGPVTCLSVRDTWQPLIGKQKNSKATMLPQITEYERRDRMVRFRRTQTPMLFSFTIASIKLELTDRVLLETATHSKLAYASSGQAIEILRQYLAKTGGADLGVRSTKPMAIEYVKHLKK